MAVTERRAPLVPAAAGPGVAEQIAESVAIGPEAFEDSFSRPEPSGPSFWLLVSSCRVDYRPS